MLSDEEDTKSVIRSVLCSHFTNGFRLDSVIDYNRLRRFSEEDFNVTFKKTDGELENDIADLGTLSEGKVFLITDDVKNWLKIDVLSVFEGGLNYVYFETYFKKNYSRLVENGIYSADMLKSILKELLPHFYFKKRFMHKEEEISLKNELIRCFDDTILLNYKHIAEKLQYLPLAIIKQSLGQNADFIWNSAETYTHVSKVEITEAERQDIRNFAQKQFSINGYVSAADMPTEDISERNCELSQTAVHNAVYRICLADNYDKRGKIIVKKGIRLDALGIMKEHCRSLDKSTLDDLLAFEKELTGEQHRWIPMEAAYATMVRADENLYIAEKHVIFDVVAIDRAIEALCFGEYIPLCAVTTFAAFPYAGQAWTMYLLESYVRRFSSAFRFAVLAVNSKNAGAIVRKACPLNYREILADAVAKSNIQLREDSVVKFLYESGYIGKRSISNTSELIGQAKIIRERG